jgi:hypothetical protein
MSVQTTRVVLAPAAQPFAEAAANPPYLFDLGPVDGRKAWTSCSRARSPNQTSTSRTRWCPAAPRGMFPCGPCAARVPHGYFRRSCIPRSRLGIRQLAHS